MAALITNRKNDLFSPKEITDSITPYQFVVTTINDFINWWYLKQPVEFIKQYIRLVDIVDDQMSTSFLIRTFFIPWHRDKQLVGYLVGIIARLIFIPVGLILVAVVTTGYISLLIFWISIPVLSVIMLLISPFR